MSVIKFPIKPRVSEKAYNLSQDSAVYVFEVPDTANKHTVAETIEATYDVTVKKVRIANIAGKSKRAYRKRQGWVDGKKSDIKKAYVTLKEGETISIFPKEDEKENDKSKQPTKSKKATRGTK
jgi:large subunit ribosomal protein L23